ncbi:MAG: DUF4870 domain-containing protein [Betaproteobacteria bacterium]|nr:DUF4870 domain-containing protein [Betaproteobacteria bacterium]
MSANTQNTNVTLGESERTFGMLVHLLGIFTWFIGPLILWLIKKEEMPFVNDQGKEAINFSITLSLTGIALLLIVTVLAFIPFLGIITSIIGMLFYPVLGIGALVLFIIAGVEANKGKYYRYPICLRFIK